jgi:hypothetical protein
MSLVPSFLTPKVMQVLAILTLGGFTLGSGVMGTTRLAESLQTPLPPAHQLTQANLPTPTDSNLAPTSPLRPTQTPLPKLKPTNPKIILPPSTTLTTLSTSVTFNNNSRCLITLFGQQYDVTSLRSTHSGGDVFACGTDMSAVYQGQHGTSLARMAPYLVTSFALPQPNGAGGLPTPPPVFQNTNHDEDSTNDQDD